MKDTIVDTYTAVPKGFVAGTDIIENDLVTEGIEYGEMNEADARSAGYITDPIEASSKSSLFLPIAIGFTAGLGALLLLRRRA